MATTYSRFLWGWEVFDSGSSQNNRLDFVANGTTRAATLNAGVYTATEFAAEVQRAMRSANGDTTDIAVSFSFSTLKFTLTYTGAGTFQLLLSTGANASTDCNGLLGFAASDETGATTYTSDDAVGSGSSTAKVWTMTDPNSKHTPVTAAADGTAASNTQREVNAVQNRTDGGFIETIYFSTVRRVVIGFRALSTSERTNMESFLDWAVKGYRFNWQPDKDSTSALRLVMANPREVNGDFEWLTRSETSYGELTFYEQTSRT